MLAHALTQAVEVGGRGRGRRRRRLIRKLDKLIVVDLVSIAAWKLDRVVVDSAGRQTMPSSFILFAGCCWQMIQTDAGDRY